MACIGMGADNETMERLFERHMFEEVLMSQLYNDIDDPITMVSWRQKTIFGDALLMYIKYTLPQTPTQETLSRMSKWIRRRVLRRRPWSVAVVVTKLIRTLRVLKNKYKYNVVIGIEDLVGMAIKRKIDFMYYKRLFNLLTECKTLVVLDANNKVFQGWGGIAIIDVNPRGTSSKCGLCHLEGKFVDDTVTELSNRKVKCKIHGTMDRDYNASINIATLALITLMRLQTLGRGKASGKPSGLSPTFYIDRADSRPRGLGINDEEGKMNTAEMNRCIRRGKRHSGGGTSETHYHATGALYGSERPRPPKAPGAEPPKGLVISPPKGS